MKQIHFTKVLSAKASKGLNKYWQSFVVEEGGEFFTYSTYWNELADGSTSIVQTSAKTLIEGKNIGRANETSPKDQAIAEVESSYRLKLDKGYHPEGEAAKDLSLPMLAHKYLERKHTVTFPCFVQPKADGLRCICDGTKMWSRQGKEFPVATTAHLLPIDTLGYEIDGELILPAPYDFQDTISAVKKFKETSPKLIYRVYDVLDTELGFAKRLEILKKIVAKNPHLVLMQTLEVADESEIFEHHTAFVNDGDEGTMIRVDGVGYVKTHRSNQLLKLKGEVEVGDEVTGHGFKESEDAEFEVIGMYEGKGKFLGAATFSFKLNDEKLSKPCSKCSMDVHHFHGCPKCSMEQRQWYWQHKDEIVGQIWTVKFQGRSKDNIPRFPVALNQRDPELQG